MGNSKSKIQQELAVAYRPGPSWLVQLLYVLGACLSVLVVLRLIFAQMSGSVFLFLESAIFMVVPVALFWAAFRIRQRNIVMTKEFIRFPAHLCVPLFFRLNRKWNDIGAVALEEEDSDSSRNDEDRWMVFHFGSGGKARIRLSELSVGGLDTFFKASKKWGSTAVIAPELIELRRKLLSGPTIKALEMSLTHIWEEELKSRFTATNFVPLSAGATLANKRIRIVAQIAAGGLSAIYLAQLTDGKKIVLKEMVIPQNSQDSTIEKAKELFAREGNLLIKLRHPQIARVFDHFVEDGRDYLVLEYIPGQSLRQLVTMEGPQAEERVLDWTSAILGILDYLHSQEPPVIHRDLTPDNIVLGTDGKLYIIDFGAANEFVGTATGTLIGKQSYISPEQFRGKSSPASDLYSLGGTLYFLLTGAEPEPLSVSHPTAGGATVSNELDDFVAVLTHLEAGSRLNNCGDAQKRLAAIKATERTTVLKFGSGRS